MIRNRIKEHVKVRAGDLVPHPLNFRDHPEEQKNALQASYDEIGFARSLLGYRLPDGRIQLIDGHLRAETTPEEEVTVEVLDVNEEEARKLLLTIDPLAELAQTNREVHDKLQQVTQTSNEALAALWATTGQAVSKVKKALKGATPVESQEQYLVMVTCEDQTEQLALLRKFRKEGLECKALTS